MKFAFNNIKRTIRKGVQIAKVFKDFSFDASDRAVLEKRRAEALKMI